MNKEIPSSAYKEDKSYSAKSFYKEDVVANYNKERSLSTKWKREQKIAEKIIGSFPKNSTFLDLPIGTGRLLPFYEKYHQKVYGIDISNDMLNHIQESKVFKNCIMSLLQGDAEKIPLPDNTVDAVISLRLFNLVPFSIVKNIIKEFSRVSSNKVIIQVRVKQKINFLTFFKKFFTDLRTNTNSLVSFFFNLFTKLYKKLSLSYIEIPKSEIQNYFIHEIDDIFDELKKNNLKINEIIEVDNGINYREKIYTPFLIIRASKEMNES